MTEIGPFGALRNAATGMNMGQRWMDVLAHNIANVSTYSRVGEEPFRAKYLRIQERDVGNSGAGVQIDRIVRAEGDAPLIFDPDHPLALRADGDGDGLIDVDYRATDDQGRWLAESTGGGGIPAGQQVFVTPGGDAAPDQAVRVDDNGNLVPIAAGQYQFTMAEDVDRSQFGLVQGPLVDLSAQMSDLIIASRHYQASARVITAAREAYQSALSIGRN